MAEQETRHPAILGYINTALAGWNVFVMVGFFLMIGLSTLSNGLVGETPIGGLHFWVAAVVAVCIAVYAAYLGGRRLHPYFRGLGLVGNCLWLTILLYLAAMTFPGRFTYAL